MIIKWADKEYEYDAAMIDVQTAIKVRDHTGMGMRSWEKAIDDCDPVALQALLWVVLGQNGERVPLKTLNFSVVEFFDAVCTAATAELVDKIAAAAAAAGGEEVDPTGTAE